LFGCWFRISIEPETVPLGNDRVIVPVVDLEVTFARAARPPSAARCFSTTSSADCAPAIRPHVRRSAAARNRVVTAFIGCLPCQLLHQARLRLLEDQRPPSLRISRAGVEVLDASTQILNQPTRRVIVGKTHPPGILAIGIESLFELTHARVHKTRRQVAL